MTERKPFLLRIDAGLYTALARWADDETRSLNGQIEALLRRAIEADGRFPASASRQPAEYGHPRLPAPLGRQPRAASREPVPQPQGRGPRRPSTPASRPKVDVRTPRRLPKPASPAPQPAVPQPAVPQPAVPQPAAVRPAQRIPADSWDAMED